MALSANRELNRYVDQELRVYPVAEGTLIHKGALVGIAVATGHARPMQSGDLFAGVAYEQADNSSGAGGAISLRVYTKGDFVLPVAAASGALPGTTVYAVDDEGVTATAASGLSRCGILLAPTSSSSGIVRITPIGLPLAELAVNVPLVSSTSAATLATVMVAQRALRLVSAQVSFTTPPDAGALDVGSTPADPDELVDAFALSGLSANTPAALTLVTPSVAAGTPVLARVGQASSTAGVGGVLSLRFVELG